MGSVFFRCPDCDGQGLVFAKRSRAGNPVTKPCGSCDGAGIGAVDAPVELAGCAQGQNPVAVVGGGIGGLALALALEQRGVRVRVYERDGALNERPPGYGLTIQQGGKALRALGLLDEARALGCYTDCHVALDAPTGALLGAHGKPLDEGDGKVKKTITYGRGAHFYYAIHLPRQALRALLLSRLQPDTVQWGRDLNAVVQAEDAAASLAYDLTFADGSTERAAVVVGADGVFARSRAALIGGDDAALEEAGIFVALGFAKLPRGDEPLVVAAAAAAAADEEEEAADSAAAGRRADSVVFEAVDGAARLYAMPFDVAARTTMWQLSWPTDPAKNGDGAVLAETEAFLRRARSRSGRSSRADRGAELHALAKSVVRAWGGTFPLALALIEATAPEDITGYPIVDRAPEDLEAMPGRLPQHTALVGDAAHPMHPFKAQGANQALLDGVDFARRLYASTLGAPAAHMHPAAKKRRPETTVQEAIEAYHADMLPRALNKVRSSRRASELLHSDAARVRSFGTTRAFAAGALLLQTPSDDNDDDDEDVRRTDSSNARRTDGA